jgi:hypothetical protein
MEMLQAELRALDGFEFDVSLTGFEIDRVNPTFAPKTPEPGASRDVTERDLERAAGKVGQPAQDAPNEIPVMCPDCGAEFTVTGE